MEKGYHNMKLGRNVICGCACTIEKDKILWDDGCIRTFYPNGHEKSAMVLYEDKTKWNFSERDINGKVTKEWNETIKKKKK